MTAECRQACSTNPTTWRSWGRPTKCYGRRWDYDPLVYGGVYRRLLTHRHCQLLPVDTVLMPQGSAYDVEIQGEELSATADEVNSIIAEIEQRYTDDKLQALVTRWYQNLRDASALTSMSIRCEGRLAVRDSPIRQYKN
jgi:hypothetical protein